MNSIKILEKFDFLYFLNRKMFLFQNQSILYFFTKFPVNQVLKDILNSLIKFFYNDVDFFSYHFKFNVSNFIKIIN